MGYTGGPVVAHTEPDRVALHPGTETTEGTDSVYRRQYLVHGEHTGFLCPQELDLRRICVFGSPPPLFLLRLKGSDGE